MAVPLRRLHHVSLHVSNGKKLAHDLVSKYNFNLFATRITDRSRQVAFRKGAAVFVVNEGPGCGEEAGGQDGVAPRRPADPRRGECLYDAPPRHPVDSVSNVCFEVEDVERSFKVLRRLGCGFLVPPTTVEDEDGAVTYSVVKSVVGNVSHTLIDKTKYEGAFLPGFDATEGDWVEEDDDPCPVTHFDHITYACPRKSTHQVMQWYQKLFGSQRFFIGR